MQFFTTPSSIVFSRYGGIKAKFSCQIHVHYGRYGVITLLVAIASEAPFDQIEGDLTEFVHEADIHLSGEMGFYGSANYELYLSVFFNAICSNSGPLVSNSFDLTELVVEAITKHLPEQR
jgi:hypothetical protein